MARGIAKVCGDAGRSRGGPCLDVRSNLSLSTLQSLFIFCFLQKYILM
jgi:hypothetical protein